MAKNFLEVFPTLNIAESLKELLGLAQVEKVTTTRDRSSIRIYLKSARLIPVSYTHLGHGGRTGIPVFLDQGEIAYHRGKTMRLPLSEIESGSL